MWSKHTYLSVFTGVPQPESKKQIKRIKLNEETENEETENEDDTESDDGDGDIKKKEHIVTSSK